MGILRRLFGGKKKKKSDAYQIEFIDHCPECNYKFSPTEQVVCNTCPRCGCDLWIEVDEVTNWD